MAGFPKSALVFLEILKPDHSADQSRLDRATDPKRAVQERGIGRDPYDYKATDTRGLSIKVTLSGAKPWRTLYRIGTVEKKLAIGPYVRSSLVPASCSQRDCPNGILKSADWNALNP